MTIFDHINHKNAIKKQNPKKKSTLIHITHLYFKGYVYSSDHKINVIDAGSKL